MRQQRKQHFTSPFWAAALAAASTLVFPAEIGSLLDVCVSHFIMEIAVGSRIASSKIWATGWGTRSVGWITNQVSGSENSFLSSCYYWNRCHEAMSVISSLYKRFEGQGVPVVCWKASFKSVNALSATSVQVTLSYAVRAFPWIVADSGASASA